MVMVTVIMLMNDKVMCMQMWGKRSLLIVQNLEIVKTLINQRKSYLILFSIVIQF